MSHPLESQILHLWTQGKNTQEIANKLSERHRKEIPEWRVHRIITAERQARLGFKTIQGGAANDARRTSI